MSPEEIYSIYQELLFWKDFVTTEQFINGWLSDEITPEFNPAVANFIKENLPEDGKVLDVGSGAVSVLHGLVKSEQIVSVDPLGDLYSLIFDYGDHNMDRPIALPGESIVYENQFDIVHMRNALDHSQDPKKVYDNLLRAVKPGGFLIIQGFEHEATHENFLGFHKWDIYVVHHLTDMVTEDMLCMVNTDDKSDIIDTGSFFAGIEAVCDRSWFVWIKKKV